jgi:cytochrome c oxidase subunit 1
MMGLNGISAVIAALGGALFVVIVVATVLFGRRVNAGQPLAFPLHAEARTVAEYGSEATLRLPGTITLIGIFSAAFALYYFVNWKYLSELWLFR